MKKQSFLFTLILSVLPMISFAQEGAWSGDLDIQGTKLPLVFHFDADGCTVDSPSQGAKGIKAKKNLTSEGKIKVEIPAIGAYYEGLMVMNMIAGTFTQ
ncbi:MAG: alpha/beta hydrolase, partial [Prevotellaceae bacterium]|nr:alpha/beta hydrolase [Candidatus Colivivens equi]